MIARLRLPAEHAHASYLAVQEHMPELLAPVSLGFAFVGGRNDLFYAPLWCASVLWAAWAVSTQVGVVRVGENFAFNRLLQNTLHPLPEPHQTLEALWAMTVDPDATQSFKSGHLAMLDAVLGANKVRHAESIRIVVPRTPAIWDRRPTPIGAY